MFQPETDDMLPRAAPKPTTPNLSLGPEALVKPQVPEVSILYGQQSAEVKNSKASALPTQSYAAWKKQVLPRVTFPPEGAEVTGIITNTAGINSAVSNKPSTELVTARSNLYPLRTITATMQPSVATNGSGHTNTHYRRSLGSLPDTAATPNNPTLQQQRRSLNTITQFTGTGTMTTSSMQEVLTICAGTQTDGNISLNSQIARDFTTKEEFAQLLTAMQTIRGDQLRLLQICEALLMQQQQAQTQQFTTKSYLQDASTQCDSPLFRNVAQYRTPPDIQETGGNEQAAIHQQQQLLNQYYAQTFNSPLPAPTAQSTVYRANTPRTNRALNAEKLQQQNNNVATVLPRPSTEQSMVMNELALKYLPSEKLNELLHELHMSPCGAQQTAPTAATVIPLRAIENMAQSPSDLSNASYKYLKKYRLLPEEHIEGYREQQLNGGQRKSPLTVRQQRQPPYQNMQSPLAIPHLQQVEMLDLEHIRNQPKLL